MATSRKGGTIFLLYGQLINQYAADKSGRDKLGLGRWFYLQFRGADGVETVILRGFTNNKQESNLSTNNIVATILIVSRISSALASASARILPHS